jgi:ParB-like chromosome segregation protein Spo0J
MRDDGQDTPVIVRIVAENRVSLGGKKIPATPFTHELVCGFRRFEAARALNMPEHLEVAHKAHKTSIANTADGTIHAVVRDVPNGLEARILNARENTNRNNLKTPDVMLVVRELSKANLNQIDIAKRLGITQGYVAKLLAISTLPAVVLAHWRDGIKVPGMPDNVSKKQLTTAELVDLANVAKNEKEGEIAARYIRMLSPVADAPNGGTAGADKVGKRITETCNLLAALVSAGVFDEGSLEWSKVIGPKKMGYLLDSGSGEQVKIIALCDLADAAYTTAVQNIEAAKMKGTQAAEPPSAA